MVSKSISGSIMSYLDKVIKPHTKGIFYVFPYGSRVYGTHFKNSDHDYIIVHDGETGQEHLINGINFTLYNKDHWQDMLNAHHISALECYFLPDHLKNYDAESVFTFSLDKNILRSSISEKASHSWVKAKKKIEVEKEYYLGWKSLFHSLRILNFGMQIAVHEKIENYSEVNHLWTDILMHQYYTWDKIKTEYQSLYNKLASAFRKVCPKLNKLERNR